MWEQYRKELIELRVMRRNVERGKKIATRNYKLEVSQAARILHRLVRGLDGEQRIVQKRMLLLLGRLS